METAVLGCVNHRKGPYLVAHVPSSHVPRCLTWRGQSAGLPRVVRAAGSRWRTVVATASLTAAAVLVPATVSDAATPAATLAVTSLSLHSGGTWGGDSVTIKGTGFNGTGPHAVSAVLFGTQPAAGFSVLNATTIQAYSPEVANQQTATHLQVVLRDNLKSHPSPADIFTFIVPNLDTPINGHWSANQSRAVANAMIGRASSIDAQPVAANPGYWTPAMGRSAVQRAAGWLGLPYSWAGGGASGPGAGSCSGDGPINVDCTFQGFDCSGLTLYAWAKYESLSHFAATQLLQAGTFHPTLGELQAGDLMFFSEGGSVISHVVMYAGNGLVIQASESGWPVRYSTLANVMSSHPRYFGATRPMSRGIQGAAPIVTSISISRSATRGGSRVTIRGANLGTASDVYFGASGTYGFSINSSTALTATIPANVAGIADVRVDNAWGESAVNRGAVVAYFASPSVTALSLSSTTPAGGSTVIITGTNFAPGTRVYFGATAAMSVRVLSSTHLSVVAPAHGAGTVAVEVRTSYGWSNRHGFTYLAPLAPTPPPAPVVAPTPVSAPTSSPVPAPVATPTATSVPAPTSAPTGA
jgi:cell wall-associated NlpC family hydrolase